MLRTWIAASALTLLTVSCAFAGVNTWTTLGPQGGEVGRIVMHPTDPNVAVAIAFSGVYRTTNGGATWTQSAHQFPNPPYALLADPDDPNRFYVFSFSNPHVIVSTDGGVTFQPLAGLPVAGVFEPRLGIAAGGVMYYTAGLGVFRSENRGVNWTERSAIVLPGDARIMSVVVHPANPDTLYALAGADFNSIAMFVSRDGATTWTRLGDYAFDRSIGDLVPNPAHENELWAGRLDGLWKSTDYGTTWSNVQFTGMITDIALNVRSGAADLIVTSYDGVFRSTDGGQSWSDITGDLRMSARPVATHPIDADAIMLSGDGIYVRGTDPGTWVENHNGIIASRVWSFEADPTTDKIYAFSGAIHASTSGNEFLPVNNRQLASLGSPPLPKLLTTIHAQPGSLLAMLSDELARSTDGGATWTLIPGFPAGPYHQLWQVESARANPLNLIVAEPQSLYRSANGGGTWTRITAGLPTDVSVYDFEFAESNPSVVYLAPYRYTQMTPQPFGVYRSDDGGTNWVAANTGIEDQGVYEIEVDPTDARTVYAIADTTLVKSTDSGITWRTLMNSLDSTARIAIDPVIPRVIYIVYGENNVLRSVNGGESFETMRSTVTFPWWRPSAVIVDPLRNSVVNVGTDGYGVQQMSVEPDISLAWGTAPTSATAGSTLSYTLFATNRGPYASSGARITIQFPQGTTELAASTQGGTCTTQQTSAICTLNPLVLNASIGITLGAKPQGAGSFATSANIVGDQPDSLSTNNTVSHSVEVTAASSPPGSPVPPPSSGGGGGGGGGSVSILLLFAALVLVASQRRAHAQLVIARSAIGQLSDTHQLSLQSMDVHHAYRVRRIMGSTTRDARA